MQVGEPLYSRLVAYGLAQPRESKRIPTLDEFLAEHLKLRAAKVKDSMHKILRKAARWSLRSVDPNTPLDRISAADADCIRAALLQKGLLFFSAALHVAVGEKR